MEFILAGDYITIESIRYFIIDQIDLLDSSLVVDVDFQVEVMVGAADYSTGFRQGEMAISGGSKVMSEALAVFIATRLASGVFVNKNTMQTALNHYLDSYQDTSGAGLAVSEKTDVFLNDYPLSSITSPDGDVFDWWDVNHLASL